MTAFTKSTAREYLESIAIAVILAMFIRTFVVQAFKIPTGSMEQNLLVGDHLLVNKFIFGPGRTTAERWALPVRDVRRGDVVVFKYPEDPSRDFIKRVIGLPGETAEVRGQRVYINGNPLNEPYVHFLEPPSGQAGAGEMTSADVRRQFGPVTVPAERYFVMGDNRDNSQDSRYWGFLGRDLIKGKALLVYWSYESREEFPARGGGVGALGRAVSAPIDFVTRTRWGRMLQLIR